MQATGPFGPVEHYRAAGSACCAPRPPPGWGLTASAPPCVAIVTAALSLAQREGSLGVVHQSLQRGGHGDCLTSDGGCMPGVVFVDAAP